MSSIVVNLFEFNPELIEILTPTAKSAKNGTGYKRADIKYQGKNLILDVPKIKSSGVFWNEPEDGGYPKPEVRVEWNDEKFSGASAIKKGYDTVYCAIFRKLAPYGEVFGQGMMTAHAKHAYPEKLDEQSEVLKMMGMSPKTNREVFRDILKNFFDYPKVSKEVSSDRSVRDFSKPMESWFFLRKSTKSDKVTGGSDPYDCQFKIATKENEASVPWSELKGEIEHTYRHAITHIYIGKGASIQKQIISSTIYNLEKGGGSVGFVAGTQDEQLKQNLDQDDMQKIMALYMMMKNASSAPSPSPQGEQAPPQISMPPSPSSSSEASSSFKEEKKPEQLPPKMDDLVKSVSAGMPAGGGISGVDPEMMAKMMAMLGK